MSTWLSFNWHLNLSKVCSTQSCCSANINKGNTTRKTNVNKELKIRKQSSIMNQNNTYRFILPISHSALVVHCLIYFLDHRHRTSLKLDICWNKWMYYKNSTFSTRKKNTSAWWTYLCKYWSCSCKYRRFSSSKTLFWESSWT